MDMKLEKGVNGGANNASQTNGHLTDRNAQGGTRGEAKQQTAKRQSNMATFSKLRKASRRPLPTERGDGTYREVLQRPTLMQDLRSLSLADLKTVKDIIKAKLKGETLQDDKTMIMERTIQVVTSLNNKSKRQEVLTNQFIDMLWYSLDHPPQLYMGDEFKYRQPDGSNNNPLMPKLGAARTPYSRTCKPGATNLGALPDPEAVYEAVMARDGFHKNPNNVSSILWYWATIVIHDIFWTNAKDPNQNDSSSYLDLSPLYGNSKKAADSIRTFKDGMLKPDTFADPRLLGNPPGVCVLLIMFNRFHNHVARNLAAINETSRFAKPPVSLAEEAAAAAWKKYDEDLFQTARLITSGLYINITLVDYVRNIVNLNRVDSQWTLDPRQEMGVATGTSKGAESGVGNVVSAEFNLCYRWHSCISEMDDKWIQDFYKQLLGDNYGDMNLQALIGAMKKFEQTIPPDPADRSFGGFTRGADGKFDDDELVNAIATAIEQPGGAFGARNVPRIMKPVEILGIIRGRKWNLAGLNEFRKHFGLKAYDTFEDINSDPGVADQLRHLYQHPDNVELYPGLVAEERKPPMVPGVGIAPTYTISRVVLSDAVSLVRGDRHYTTDYHPGYLTQWGYNEANYEFDVNHGCVFYKLFLRAFPNHFAENSVYAHYPMVIPSENRKILTDLGRVERFDFTKPGVQTPAVSVVSYSGAKYIYENAEKFRALSSSGTQFLLGGTADTFALSGTAKLRDTLLQPLRKDAVKAFFAETAKACLAQKSYQIAKMTQVDVVRDVGNLVFTRFVSRLFNISLKTQENPKGVFSEQELYTTLSTVFTCLFGHVDAAYSFRFRQHVKAAADQLGEAIETNVRLCKTLGMRGFFTGPVAKNDALSQFGVHFVKTLAKQDMSAHNIAWHQVLPAAAALVPTQAQMFAESLDFYLSEKGASHLPELQRLAASTPSEATDALLLAYALEGVRMAGTFTQMREATEDTVLDDGRRVNIAKGARVHILSAALSSVDEFSTSRSAESYTFLGAGPHACLGREVCEIALTELFRAVFNKEGLGRVTGPLGSLKKVPGTDGAELYLSEDWGHTRPFPASMKVTFAK